MGPFPSCQWSSHLTGQGPTGQHSWSVGPSSIGKSSPDGVLADTGSLWAPQELLPGQDSVLFLYCLLGVWVVATKC